MRARTRTAALALVAACAALAPTAASGVSSSATATYADAAVTTIAVGDLAGAVARGRVRGARELRASTGADVVGATWRGDARELQVRTRTAGGRWSDWSDLHADAAHGPDPGTRERRAAGRRVSDPVWTGPIDRIQLRSPAGTARDVRVVLVDADAIRPPRTGRGPTTVLGARDAIGLPLVTGGIHLRSEWGAAAPKATPEVADELRGAVIHHTDSPNGYACSQVPAMLRAFQRYHMQTKGWNDIGYNLLVDRCGGVWEGRAGGVTEPVIGAHAAGFNTNTVGIALIGTHTAAAPTSRARLALRRLVAWRLDVGHVRPNAMMVLTARTGDKYPVGSTVRVRAVSGHRDLFPTSCPGDAEYRDLTALAGQAWRTGGPKVANITTSYRLRAPQDPLDASVATVTARAVTPFADEYVAFRFERVSTGELLAVAGGRGLVRTATWTAPPATSVPAWDVRVVVNGARPDGRRARGATVPLVRVSDDPGLRITTAPPATVTPNGDGVDDDVVLSYQLALDYRLQAQLLDPATGAVAATLLAPTYVGPTGDVPRELRLAIPAAVAAGSYELRLSLPADSAQGRSVYRTPLSVVR